MEHTVFNRIRKELSAHDVVLYMKGTAAFPMCGFSAAVVQMLTQVGASFLAVNVLEDGDIRNGIKLYSRWPTIPQLFVRGEFVGGADIIREMYETGELRQLLQKKGNAGGISAA